jgi:hypothetical protein
MSTVEPCHKCGVPLSVSGQFEWESNGVISVSGAPYDRNILYESRVIDNLWTGIEQLIGRSIQSIVIESRRREVRHFIEKALGDIVEFFRGNGPADDEEKAIAKETVLTIMDVGSSYGYGQYRLGEGWERGEPFPWRINTITEPYSLPLRIGEILGSIEALEGRDMAVAWKELGSDSYGVNCYPEERPAGLKDRLKRRRYEFKSGDLAFERCDICGIPLEVAHYDWHMAEGIILDPNNGWRMALYPPNAVEAVLLDLENELGEMIPDLAVQAQKLYVKSRVGGENWRHGKVTFGQLVALRGLGNLSKFEVDENHLSLKIDNSCLQPLMAGMAQALFELALSKDKTSYEWDLAEDGDLEILIKA